MDLDASAMPVKYLDAYPELPIDAPFGHPHIIDLECLDHDYENLFQAIGIADLVVTVLFHFKPQVLTAFLDLKRPRFHYIRADLANGLDFCIKRDERTVTVGFLKEKEARGWDTGHVYSIDGESTEEWTPVMIDFGDGQPIRDAPKVLDQASVYAYSMFMDEPWHGEHEVEVVCGLSDGRNF